LVYLAHAFSGLALLLWPLWKTIALLKGHFFSKAA
jgi:hypothetical protein